MTSSCVRTTFQSIVAMLLAVVTVSLDDSMLTHQFSKAMAQFHMEHGLCTQYARCWTVTADDSMSLCSVAHQHLDSWNTSSSTWSDIKYGDATLSKWKAIVHLERAIDMARASHRNACADRDQLRIASIYSLRWWLDNEPENKNWWWTQLGGPQHVAGVMLLLRDHISWPDMSKGTRFLARALPLATKHGQNGVWARYLLLAKAALTHNATELQRCADLSWTHLRIAPNGTDGLQPDQTFFEHTHLIQNGGYGADFMLNYATLLQLTSAFPSLAPPFRPYRVLVDYLLDGQQYLWRWNGVKGLTGRIYWDLAVKGRELARPDTLEFNPAPLLTALAFAVRPHRRDELIALRQRLSHHLFTSMPSTATPVDEGAAIEEGINSFVGTRHFHNGDYWAHRRRAFFVSVRLASTRSKGTECVNMENTQGFHLADGVTFIYRDGEEYLNSAPAWDWQSLPGTTLPTAQETPAQPCTIRHYGRTALSGGAGMTSPNGGYAVAGMAFEALNFSVPTPDAHQAPSPLRALKTYFLLDEGLVALGSDIYGVGQVRTTIDQTRLRGPVLAVPLSALGSPAKADRTRNFSAESAVAVFGLTDERRQFTARTVFIHDRTIYMPRIDRRQRPRPDQASNQAQNQLPGQELVVRHVDVLTDWQYINALLPRSPVNVSLLKIQILHPADPAGAAYSYAVLPGALDGDLMHMTAAELLSKIKKLVVQSKRGMTVLRSDSHVHALAYRPQGLSAGDCYVLLAVYGRSDQPTESPCRLLTVRDVSAGTFLVVRQDMATQTLFLRVATAVRRQDEEILLTISVDMTSCRISEVTTGYSRDVKLRVQGVAGGTRLAIRLPVWEAGHGISLSCGVQARALR